MKLPTRKLKRSESAALEGLLALIFIELILDVIGISPGWVLPLSVLIAVIVGLLYYHSSSRSSADSWDRMVAADIDRAKAFNTESFIWFVETFLRTRGLNPEFTKDSLVVGGDSAFDILFQLGGVEAGLKVLGRDGAFGDTVAREMALGRQKDQVERVILLTNSHVSETQISAAKEHGVEIWGLESLPQNVASAGATSPN